MAAPPRRSLPVSARRETFSVGEEGVKSCHYCVKTNTAKNQYEKAKKLKKATPIVADTISSALSCPSTSNCNRIFTEFDSNLEKEVSSSKFFSPLFVLRVSVQLGARGWGEGGGGMGIYFLRLQRQPKIR